MKAIIGKIHFSDKFKSSIHFILCSFYRITLFIPWKQVSSFPKRIAAYVAEGMPVSAGKFEKLFHRFPAYHFVFIIPAKCERVVGFCSFVFDLRNIFKKLCFTFHDSHVKIIYEKVKKLIKAGNYFYIESR